MTDEVTGNNEAAYREFLCGKGLITLTDRQWRLISIPCDTGSNEVQNIFKDSLGTYGNNAQWVMYEQDPQLDNYEVNANHKNTEKRMLDPTDTLSQGQSYWINIDAGGAGNTKTVTIPKTLPGLSPTSTTPTSLLSGINDPDFTEAHLHYLPNNDMNTPGSVKKYMAGNPFPYAFMVKHLYFSHDPANNDYYPMGDSTNDPYINATFYKHDSSSLSPVTDYEAVNAGTPGFDQGGIKAMEGFFIKIEEVPGDTADNYFAFPLIMKDGNGN
jgi:hypothetical protein